MTFLAVGNSIAIGLVLAGVDLGESNKVGSFFPPLDLDFGEAPGWMYCELSAVGFGDGLVEKMISSCRMSGEEIGDASDELDMVLEGGGGRLFKEDRYEEGLNERPKLAILSTALFHDEGVFHQPALTTSLQI